jgi:hypothetical protein
MVGVMEMKPLTANFQDFSKCFWRRCVGLLLVFVLLGTVDSLHAGPGPSKLLKLERSKDGRIAKVQVPAGFGKVTLQRFDRVGGWKKVASKQANSALVKFRLPADAASDVRWRAIGTFVNTASRDKFPAAFYQGRNSFELESASGVGALAPAGVEPPRISTDLGGVPEAITPEEADIWKADGGTVYFFNQLRGLQVLDVSTPADPRLTASLRLPAVGEDLYLLSGEGAVRHLILLTRRSSKLGPMTRINLVKVEAGRVEITHWQDVPGSLSDSRLAGKRLILATTTWSEGDASGGASSTLSQWEIAPEKQPQASGSFEILGDSPWIASGADWLAVAVSPRGDRRYSEVTVFGLEEAGLVQLTAKPVRTAGLVADPFKIQWRNNILTTISERNASLNRWAPVTVLENFRVWGAGVIHTMEIEEPFEKLELAKGESLYATRFDGDKAYIVTFLETDPLWIVDLSDPSKPVVAGHLEVPGWSTHLEPLGDQLLSIGWESDTVAASLFDVSDPVSPKLLRRLNLGAPGSYSEAAWDEKALKVIPDAGLVLVPLTSHDAESGKWNSVVQVLDLDLEKRDLIQRGSIAHEFDARRSEWIGGAVVSISQRVLVAADVSDRDAPSILSEVSLAWPVDRVLDAGSHLLQIEAGSAFVGGSGQSRASVRVSAHDAPEAVFSETDLGDGHVRGADFRDGKLYILRELRSGFSMFYRSSIMGGGGGELSLVLDVYDGSALPVLSRLGSVSTKIPAGMNLAGSGLLWPQPQRPAVVLDAQSSFWYWDRPIVIGEPVVLAAQADLEVIMPPTRFPFWRPRTAPRVLAFDVAEPAAPAVAESVMVGTVETVPNGIYAAAHGRLVVGARDWKNEATGKAFPVGKIAQSVHVVEVPAVGTPIARPGIDLPGELVAVSELDADGFLAFTRSLNAEETPTLKVSACDGFDAFEVTSLAVNPTRFVTAGGRKVFVTKSGAVESHQLTDEGVFVPEPEIKIGWTAQQLRWSNGVLLGVKGNQLFASEAGRVSKWKFPTWGIDFDQVSIAEDGDLLVPFGEYGAERLER